MLAIRMQRTGRSGHAMFRIIVQDSRRTPTSGKLVAQIGHYDPHQKTITLDKEKAKFYLDHGAQPSPRVVKILKIEAVKLPKWVTESSPAPGKLRNPEKLRRNRPPEEKAPTPVPEPAAEAVEAVETESEVPASAEVEAVKPETAEPEVTEEAESKEDKPGEVAKDEALAEKEESKTDAVKPEAAETIEEVEPKEDEPKETAKATETEQPAETGEPQPDEAAEADKEE